MKLTRIERWILSNQYKILEKLDPEEAAFYASVREILDCGYELEYDWNIPHISNEESCLTAAQCSEVLDILSMFRDLHDGYEALADKSDINDLWVRFLGFDANTESTLLGYCEHVFAQDKFTELRPTGRDGSNSHMPTLDFYRRMHAAWQPFSKRGGKDLTKAEIITIINEAPHPESEIGQLKNADVKTAVQ